MAPGRGRTTPSRSCESTRRPRSSSSISKEHPEQEHRPGPSPTPPRTNFFMTISRRNARRCHRPASTANSPTLLRSSRPPRAAFAPLSVGPPPSRSSRKPTETFHRAASGRRFAPENEARLPLGKPAAKSVPPTIFIAPDAPVRGPSFFLFAPERDPFAGSGRRSGRDGRCSRHTHFDNCDPRASSVPSGHLTRQASIFVSQASKHSSRSTALAVDSEDRKA